MPQNTTEKGIGTNVHELPHDQPHRRVQPVTCHLCTCIPFHSGPLLSVLPHKRVLVGCVGACLLHAVALRTSQATVGSFSEDRVSVLVGSDSPPNFERSCVFQVILLAADASPGHVIKYGSNVALVHRLTNKVIRLDPRSLGRTHEEHTIVLHSPAGPLLGEGSIPPPEQAWYVTLRVSLHVMVSKYRGTRGHCTLPILNRRLLARFQSCRERCGVGSSDGARGSQDRVNAAIHSSGRHG
jgi:hypothetical protein